MDANSGHETGIISDAALSFIVQEPSGIIDVSRPTSFRSSERMYRIICVSEWWLLNTGCVRYSDDRLSAGGTGPAVPAPTTVAGDAFPAASANTSTTSCASPLETVSSNAMPIADVRSSGS